MAYEAYNRQCAWVQVAGVGPLGWHVARIMTDMVYAAYPALRPAIDAHRAKGAAGQGAVTGTATDAPEARARAMDVETIERLRRIRMSMILLQQNSEGCVLNHHESDGQLHGIPGWLMDTAVDIERLTDIITDLLAQARAK